MTSKEATELRIKLERKGWKVLNGKMIPPNSIFQKIKGIEGVNMKQAKQLQDLVDSFYE